MRILIVCALLLGSVATGREIVSTNEALENEQRFLRTDRFVKSFVAELPADNGAIVRGLHPVLQEKYRGVAGPQVSVFFYRNWKNVQVVGLREVVKFCYEVIVKLSGPSDALNVSARQREDGWYEVWYILEMDGQLVVRESPLLCGNQSFLGIAASE